jgi:cell shape-determining protein MreD
MNKILIIYAAVVFILAVIVFTISELNKNTEQEPETFRWMKVFSFVLLAMALICLLAGRG